MELGDVVAVGDRATSAWSELGATLPDHCTVAEAHPDWVGLVWRFADAHSETQRQILHLVGPERDWLRITSPAVATARLRAADALVWNATSRAGCAAIREQWYVVTNTVPNPGLGPNTLVRHLEAIARGAVELRRRAATVRADDALAHFVD